MALITALLLFSTSDGEEAADTVEHKHKHFVAVNPGALEGVSPVLHLRNYMWK